MNVIGVVEHLIDRLTPEVLAESMNTRKRVRMFVLSHVFGPFLGLPIPIFLYFADPHPLPHVLILAASVAVFWLFLPLIRVLPTHYTGLALLSITDLNFAVLWAAFNYGGSSSPFLMWYMLLPMLAFFYLGGSRRAQIMIFGEIVVGLGAFSAAFVAANHTFPVHIPLSHMAYAGIVSAFCSTTYAFFMATYYTQVVDSQSELVKEIDRHEATLELLTVAKKDADIARTLVEARNTDLEAAKKHLEYNSLHDALTGLPNRRYLDEVLARQAADYQPGKPIALLHIDLDAFKQINDTLGHIAGDAMLIHAAKLLRANIGPDDFVARVGGDEFIIISRCGSAEALTRMGRTLIDLIRQPVPYKGNFCRFGACIGIAAESGAQVSAERLLVNSDVALYRAKAAGRNKTEFFSQKLQAQIIHDKMTADDVLRGLEHREFIAHYQPQFDAKTFAVVGVEALVRWQHPLDGLRGPVSFLRIAEDLNAVATIDRLVLEQALTDFDTWSRAGLDIGRVSVNVSGKRLNDEELLDGLELLDFKRGSLSFELVESIFLDETDQLVADNIERIRKLGIDIEIDDFGTGHASIVGLLNISPARLKIDRQFITHITELPEHSRLVASIIEIGHSLGIEVVAEGVETIEQAHHLSDLGCDVLQGYVFARPMSAEALDPFVREWSSAHTRSAKAGANGGANATSRSQRLLAG